MSEHQGRSDSATVDARPPGHADVLVVGAGIGGLYALHAMRQLGLDVRGFELGSDVGGTWFWNRYPGARCDIESLEYSFQFDDELQHDWQWSERYAAQPEILAYINHIADRYELRSRIEFDTRIDRVEFDDHGNRWKLTTRTGREWFATYLVMATGGISVPRFPDIAGQGKFEGVSAHTALWPSEGIEVRGKRVAVIGTGSSAIQAIPELAAEAEQLFVLQRSPNYVVPSQNSEPDPAVEDLIKANYTDFRRNNDTYANGFGTRWNRSDESALAVSDEERERCYASAWQTGGFSFLFSFGDLTSSTDAAETAARFIQRRIADIVDDPVTAAVLTPRHIFGCRRLCVGTDYYETYNRPNVHLIDVGAEPITEITAAGVRYGGQDLDVDVIIYATGFEDQPASLQRLDIRGPGGSLGELWAEQPSNYLGVAVAGLPNLFVVNMPGSPSIATNMMTNTEFTVDFITGAIRHARRNGADRIEADAEAQRHWTEYVDSLGHGKVYNHCQNLYVGTTDAGRRYVLPHLGVPAYLERVRKESVAGYPGLRFSSAHERDTAVVPPAASEPAIRSVPAPTESPTAPAQLEGVL